MPYISDCIIEFPLNDFITTLKLPNPLITSLSSELQTRLASFGTTSKSIPFNVHSILSCISVGPALFVYTPKHDDVSTSEM